MGKRISISKKKSVSSSSSSSRKSSSSSSGGSLIATGGEEQSQPYQPSDAVQGEIAGIKMWRAMNSMQFSTPEKARDYVYSVMTRKGTNYTQDDIDYVMSQL